MLKQTKNLIRFAEIMDRKLKKMSSFIDEEEFSIDKKDIISTAYNLATKIDDIVNTSISNIITPEFESHVKYKELAPNIMNQKNDDFIIKSRLEIDSANIISDLKDKDTYEDFEGEDNLSRSEVRQGISESINEIKTNILDELSRIGFKINNNKAIGKFDIKTDKKIKPYSVTISITDIDNRGGLSYNEGLMIYFKMEIDYEGSMRRSDNTRLRWSSKFNRYKYM